MVVGYWIPYIYAKGFCFFPRVMWATVIGHTWDSKGLPRRYFRILYRHLNPKPIIPLELTQDTLPRAPEATKPADGHRNS